MKYIVYIYSIKLFVHYINVREYQRGQSKFDNPEKTGNIVYTRRRKTKQKHNTIYVGYHYAQTHTNNVNKTWALLQTTGGKDEPNIVCMRKS